MKRRRKERGRGGDRDRKEDDGRDDGERKKGENKIRRMRRLERGRQISEMKKE